MKEGREEGRKEGRVEGRKGGRKVVGGGVWHGEGGVLYAWQ